MQTHRIAMSARINDAKIDEALVQRQKLKGDSANVHTRQSLRCSHDIKFSILSQHICTGLPDLSSKYLNTNVSCTGSYGDLCTVSIVNYQ